VAIPKNGVSIKVLVVDDQQSFAQALSLALGLEDDLEVRAVTSGEAAGAAIGEDRPDVIILDAGMPGDDGVEVTRRIRRSDPTVGVIVLSDYEDEVTKARALEAGASGVLSKTGPLAGVIDAVRRIRAGEPLVPPEEVERLLRRVRHRRREDSTEAERADRLSLRERQILQLMAEGLIGKEIAARLTISPHTLRTHMQNIMTKLGVHTKTQAVLVALRHGKVVARMGPNLRG
jgi:DNA-binding NarL/FixJ family response regulator